MKTYTISKYLLIELMLAFICFKSVSQSNVSFYVVGHQDDWQLFMAKNSINDLLNSNNKSIFITLTAGDAGWGDTGGGNAPYFKGRENGSILSAKFLASANDYSNNLTPQERFIDINGHDIYLFEYKNTKSYFFRLPDGNPNGEGYSRNNYESIQKLYFGEINNITSVEQSTTYNSWEDLRQTIQSIILKETNGFDETWINIADIDNSINPGDHSDHIYSAILATEAVSNLTCVGKYHWVEYHSANLPINLTNEEIENASSLFTSCVVGMIEAGYGTNWDFPHTVMISRDYFRITDTPNKNCDGIKFKDITVDPLEPNNNYNEAYNLNTNTSYNNTNLFITPGDEDWLLFRKNNKDYFIRIKGNDSTVEGAYGLNFSINSSNLTIETFQTNGLTNTELFLYDTDHTTVLAYNDNTNGVFSKLTYEFSSCTDPLEPKNDYNTAYDLGSDIFFTNSQLCLTQGDEDWFKFTSNNKEYYFKIDGYNPSIEGGYGLNFSISGNDVTIETFITTGETDTKISLYNTDHITQLAFNDDFNGLFSKIVYKIPLDLPCPDTLESDNNFSLATDLGELENYNNESLCLTPGDEDWFRFTSNNKNYYIKINGYNNQSEGQYGLRVSLAESFLTIETYETNGSTDTKIYLYDSDHSTQLEFNDDNVGYFSKITYFLTSNIPCPDSLEPNNLFSTAYDIATTQNYVNPNLCLTQGDTDWFKFNYFGKVYYFMINGYNNTIEGNYGIVFSRSSTSLSIETFQTNGNTDTQIYLYDMDHQTQLAFNDDNVGLFSMVEYNFPPDTDPLESNDDYDIAYDLGTRTNYSNLQLGLTQGDKDWSKFTYDSEEYYFKIQGIDETVEGTYGLNFSLTGSTVTIETIETEGVTNTVLYLYDTDHITELAFNDDNMSVYSMISHSFSIIYESSENNSSRIAVENINTIRSTNTYNKAISVFPNPSSGQLNIILNDLFEKEVEIAIVDIKGNIVYSKTLDPIDYIVEEVIDLDNNQKGNYIFIAHNKNRLITRKFVLK